MGSQMLNRTTSYIYEDGVFTVDISGVERDYYKKDSEAYKKALKDLDEKLTTIINLFFCSCHLTLILYKGIKRFLYCVSPRSRIDSQLS